MTDAEVARLEPGYYYADQIRGKIERGKIVRVAEGRIHDTDDLLALAQNYELLGPVPKLTELENLTEDN